MLHSHSMNAVLATLLDPTAKEFRVTNLEMVKVGPDLARVVAKLHALEIGHSVLLASGIQRPLPIAGMHLAQLLCRAAASTGGQWLLAGHAVSHKPAGVLLLQGIAGVGYFDSCVVPIIENTARECELTDRLRQAIKEYPEAHAVLVRRHGVYVWGSSWIQVSCFGLAPGWEPS